MVALGNTINIKIVYHNLCSLWVAPAIFSLGSTGYIRFWVAPASSRFELHYEHIFDLFNFGIIPAIYHIKAPKVVEVIAKMTDQYIPLRQQLPGQTVTHINGRQLPTPMMVSNSEASDLSFESILNRNQESQNQINSMPQSYMAQKHAQLQQNQSPNLNQRQMFQPAGLSKSEPNHQQSPASQNPIQELPPQAKEIINKASADIPQGEDLYKTMIANAQEYQTMKNNNQFSNPGMQTNSMAQGLYNSVQPNQSNQPPQSVSAKPKVQITPSYSNIDVQAIAKQPINADLMENQKHTNQTIQNTPNTFNSALSMQPQYQTNEQNTFTQEMQKQQFTSSNQNDPATSQNNSLISKYQNSVSPGLQDLKNNESVSDETNSHAKTPNALDATGLFFKNIASGLTLGFYHPPEEPKPHGVMRIIEPVKSLVWDAPKSLIVDVPVGIAHSFNGKEEQNNSSPSNTTINKSESLAYDVNIRDRHSSKPWMNRNLS